MVSSVAGPLRVTRAALVATLVLAVGAGAHVVGGGHLPDLLLLAALAAFTLAGTMVAARARFTVPRLVALLGGAQLALHVALDVLGHGAGACAPTGTASAGHGAHVAVACGPVPDGGAGLGSAVPFADPPVAAVPGLWMVVAHAVATLVLAFVLARGERALERFLAWVTPRVLLPAPVLVVARRQAGVVPTADALPASWRPTSAPTRGPPRAVHLVGTSR